jgi:archaemetzincin
VRPDLVEYLRTALARHGFVVVGTQIIELGTAGYHAQRRQYNSKTLLGVARRVAKGISDWHVKVLLMTDADIYDTDTLFVAGQAEVNGKAAVVSVARLSAGDEGRFLGRVVKESIHELGHTLGLGHCNNHDCVMFPSRVLADSDVKDHVFCQRCKTKAGRALTDIR